MKCPFCFKHSTRVLDSRPSPEMNSVRRRRMCSSCSRRFTTYERVEAINLYVLKRSGAKEAFNKEKLLKGILKACEKRPVPYDKIQAAVEEIEAKLRQQGSDEVESKLIGKLVIEKLKELDDVAYVRFASVYKKFNKATQFLQEVERLKK
ncbi:MAG: transcriptional regulator NrdR [Candidatus Woesearchaeota archaeon]